MPLPSIHALTCEAMEADPGLERETDANVVTGRARERRVRQRLESVRRAEHLHGLGIDHGSAEAGGQCGGRAEGFPFMDGDERRRAGGRYLSEGTRSGKARCFIGDFPVMLDRQTVGSP